MNKNQIRRVEHRILVTGSRGKSSIVRLLCVAFCASGFIVAGRITGVLPRSITGAGERVIRRNGPGHVLEMGWWLGELPPETEVIVMENSAVHPDLQHLAGEWLMPTLTLCTNARPDHQELWGLGEAAAARAIVGGLPKGRLLLGEVSQALAQELAGRSGEIYYARAGRDHLDENLELARLALKVSGVFNRESDAAMIALGPDIADFRVFSLERGELAAAFSANDSDSTARLFALLGWREEETYLYFSGREDRPGRLRSFRDFFARPWLGCRSEQRGADADELYSWMTGKQVFGCGNVAGTPLALIGRLLDEGRRWTIPRW